RLEAGGLRSRRRAPYPGTVLWLEARQLAAGASRRVLTVSALAAREIACDYVVPPGRLAVIYNGVDGERFHPAQRAVLGPALRREVGVAPDVPLCAAIGSGFRRKGFDLLLALWRRSPPAGAALILVGDGERVPSLRGRAAGPPPPAAGGGAGPRAGGRGGAGAPGR